MLILMQRGGQRSVSVICSGKACRIFTELCDPVGHALCVCDQRPSGTGHGKWHFLGIRHFFSGSAVPGAWRAHLPAASVRQDCPLPPPHPACSPGAEDSLSEDGPDTGCAPVWGTVTRTGPRGLHAVTRWPQQTGTEKAQDWPPPPPTCSPPQGGAFPPAPRGARPPRWGQQGTRAASPGHWWGAGCCPMRARALRGGSPSRRTREWQRAACCASRVPE